MLFTKIETVEKHIGPYLLVSIPYGDVILLEEELCHIWKLLPSDTFMIAQLASCMQGIGINSNREAASLLLERFLQLGLIIKK